MVGENMVGVSLKAQHYQTILEQLPPLGWFEVHCENYMGAGGAPHYYLGRIAENYPISFHGVGMSLGSCQRLDKDHLFKLRELVDRYCPFLVSEHLAWCGTEQRYLNDLLPMPYTAESLDVLVRHVDEMQTTLRRQILIENPSSYLEYRGQDYDEAAFLVELARRSGCKILLDINNIYVSSCNHGWDALAYLRSIPADIVGEIHLAGHHVRQWRGQEIRIDDHGSNVCEAVWALFENAVGMVGIKPTLVEWDSNVPSLLTLLQEAGRASLIMDKISDRVGCHGG
ncbi:MAG: hypothetical protein CMF31_08525 [Kordiimonas sp.]|nr:hypothetical protein [Kordiimonas sp.]